MSTFNVGRVTTQRAASAPFDPAEVRHEAQSIDETLEEIDEGLRSILAILHDVDEGLAASTLSALPFGQRAALEAYDIIESSSTRNTDATDAMENTVVITEFGRQLIAACALEQAPQEVRDAIAALDEARARRLATKTPGRVRVYSNRKTT